MCRHLAYYSERPIRAAELLIEAPNALLAQGCCDLRGESHGHGWGVGWYTDRGRESFSDEDLASTENPVPKKTPDPLRLESQTGSTLEEESLYLRGGKEVARPADLKGSGVFFGQGTKDETLSIAEKDSRPQVVRSEKAVGDDRLFRETAAKVLSPLAIGHVRQASVGNLSLENTHPFAHGCWLFAHNGTLQGFDEVSKTLEAEIDPALLRFRQGTTDSELIFFWILAGLQKLGATIDRPIADSGDLIPFFCEVLVRLSQLSEKTDPKEPSKFNFLLTDGRTLLATRWNHSLHWLDRSAATDAQRQVVIASEPIGGGAWREMPEQSILVVDERFHIEQVQV